jgi:hypothetical protein
VAARFAVEGPWLVGIDAAALVPLFATGRTSQLPPDAAKSGAPWMARVFAKLGRIESLRVSPWARFQGDATQPDEVRVLVLPRAAMPGLVGVEIGLAWSSTPVGWTATPEVLARVLDGSPAAARLTRDVQGVRPVPGRRPEERVARLQPLAPTRGRTVALARALAEALTDRRVETRAPKKPWAGSERRTPRPAAAPRPPNAPLAAPVACSL